MKDSLVYRGTVLWNTICLNENGIAHLSKKDRNLIRTKDYFKDLNSTLSPPRLRGVEMPISYTIDDLLVDTVVSIINIINKYDSTVLI